ncbi:MAG TPA: hypothetical protein VGZ00_09165 [Candidatus Baltobacteraceae bacterium]|jgi:hypothetical protein|nr:hypothetical protein [Candidatus Baltobacteraceae bacterium]
MDVAATLEKTFAFIGAIVVLLTALYQFKNEMKTSWRLDNILTRLLLGLLVLGCVLVILATVGVIGHGAA